MKLNRENLLSLITEVMKHEDLQEPVKEGELPSQGASEQVQAAFDSLTGPDGVSQIAFITAENPPGMKTKKNPDGFSWHNKTNMFSLKDDLDSLGYDYYSIMGDYGGPEGSLMVIGNRKTRPEMKQDMIVLGKKYLQDSIIVGQKQTYKNPFDSKGEPTKNTAKYRMLFSMLMLHPFKNGEENDDDLDYSVGETRDLVLRGDDIQARTEFYSKIDGKKFVIPFFSEQPEHELGKAERPEYPVGMSKRDR